MISVINQFENDHKKVENFQRKAASSDKSHQFDYMKNQLLMELQNQKEKYIKKPKKKNKKKILLSQLRLREILKFLKAIKKHHIVIDFY